MSAGEKKALNLAWLWTVLFALTTTSFLLTLYHIFFIAPAELQMGIVFKIFFFHVPSALAMYVGFGLAGLGSAVYLKTKKPFWDALAISGAEVGTLFCIIVLVTGPLWGRKAWGHYWVWDPRLTSTMLTAMIYLSFLALRSGSPGAAEKRFAAALAIIGLPMLPLIHYSVQRWAGQHPTVLTEEGGGISAEMVPSLLGGFTSFSLLVVWLLWARIRVERQRQEIDSLDLELAGS